MSKTLTHDEKVAMFRATAFNLQDRMDFAATRAEIINPIIEAQSSIRNIFKTEQIGAGTPVYDLPHEDIECVWAMPAYGQYPSVQIEGKQLSINTFGVFGGVDYSMDIASDGRYNMAELATNLLKNNHVKMEELCGWKLIAAHAAVLPASQKLQAFLANGNAGTPGNGLFNSYTLSELITLADELGIGGRRVTDVYLSPRRFNDMRLLVSAGLTLPDEVKMQMWGGGEGPSTFAGVRIHKIYNSALVPNNKAYAFTQKDGYRYGVMPIRENVRTFDNPLSMMENKIGILSRGRYGFGVLDDKGLIEITF